MGRRFRRRRSGDLISLGQSTIEDGGGWEINHASASATDEHMTALVNACTHPDYHDNKNVTASGGATETIASHSAQNVGHTIKRSLSFLELPSELFGDDSIRIRAHRRKRTIICAVALLLVLCSVLLFRRTAEEEIVVEQREVDFGDHKKSLNQVAHSTEQSS